MTQNILLQKRLETLSKIPMYFVLVISFSLLVSKFVLPSLFEILCWHTTPMLPVGALAYLLTGIAYLLITADNGKKVKKILARIIATLLVSLGMAVLITQLTGHTISFLTQIVNRNNVLTERIHIPPVSACFIVYGLAIWLIDYEIKGKIMLSQLLVVPITILGAYLSLGFLFNSAVLINATTNVPLPVYSSIFNLMIPFSIFFTHSDKGIAGEITKTMTGGKTLFNLLPVVILIPVIIGLIHLYYIPASTPFGLAFLILLFILFCIGIVYFNLIIINKDLEERLRVESELKDSMRNVSYLSNLIERSTDAIMMIDENYIIKQWNKGAEKVYGYTAEEVIGKNKYELLDAPYLTPEQFKDGVNKLFESGGERTSTRLQNCKNGKILNILQSSVALQDEEGNYIGYIGIGKDITTLVEKDIELESLNSKLDMLVKAKTNELNSVYERISDAVICLDENWCYTYYNKMAFNLTKETAGIENSLLGKNIWEQFPYLKGSALYEAYHKAFKEQVSVRIEFYYTEFDMWTEQTIYPSMEGLSVFLRDITEKKIAEIKQKDAEEQYKNIVETAHEGILIRDEHGVITFVNDYMCELLNETKEFLIGKNILDYFKDEHARKMEINMDRRKNGFTDNYEIQLQLLDKTVIEISIKSSPFYHKDKFAGALAMITDITDRKKKEEDLKKLSDDLRSLSTYLQNIREEERKKIAMEIHDELGQNLAILKMDAAWISKHVDTDNFKIKERLIQFNKITDDTVQTSRRLYNYLYPQMLDDIGLVGTINWHANSYIKPTNIQFTLNTIMSETILPEHHNLWLVLYRVYQECMTNIIRYANAKSIVINLYQKDDIIVMEIIDDGIGFEVDKVNTRQHHGLLGMRERVYSIGGTISIDSVIERGTNIQVNIPVPVPEMSN